MNSRIRTPFYVFFLVLLLLRCARSAAIGPSELPCRIAQVTACVQETVFPNVTYSVHIVAACSKDSSKLKKK